MTDKAREALKSLRNATYRFAGNASYEELVLKMFDNIDTIDRELRRCRAETLREAAHYIDEVWDGDSDPHYDLLRMADETEQEVKDEKDQ